MKCEPMVGIELTTFGLEVRRYLITPCDLITNMYKIS